MYNLEDNESSEAFTNDKVIRASVGEIDWKGEVDIEFSDYVYVSEDAINWSSTNIGASFISVKHLAS